MSGYTQEASLGDRINGEESLSWKSPSTPDELLTVVRESLER
jgi:hypothetical protein